MRSGNATNVCFMSRIKSMFSVTYVAAPVFIPADGAVGSFQNPADGVSGDVTVDVQSCERLKNTAFTNSTRSMNAYFSHNTYNTYKLLGLVEVLHLHS